MASIMRQVLSHLGSFLVLIIILLGLSRHCSILNQQNINGTKYGKSRLTQIYWQLIEGFDRLENAWFVHDVIKNICLPRCITSWSAENIDSNSGLWWQLHKPCMKHYTITPIIPGWPTLCVHAPQPWSTVPCNDQSKGQIACILFVWY